MKKYENLEAVQNENLPTGIKKIIKDNFQELTGVNSIDNKETTEKVPYEAYVLDKNENKSQIEIIKNLGPEYTQSIRPNYCHELYVLGNTGYGVSVFYPI